MQVNNVSPYPTPMVTEPSTTYATSSTSSSSSTATGLGNPNLFISLLTAQLQAQDPLNPMSPQDMVSQLTEVSSLQELVSINQTLTNISNGTTSTTAA